jgi:adhesin/invasin
MGQMPGGVSDPNPTTPAQGSTPIQIFSGDQQNGLPGFPLPAPLVVRVTDPSGAPVSGVMVAFAVTGGGGTLSSVNAPTNTTGLASTNLTLGPQPGANSVTASLMDGSGSSVSFTEMGTASTKTITFVDDVQPILNAQCIMCHAPGGMSSFTPLTTYEQVRYGVSFFTSAPLVVPDNPGSSYIVVKTGPTGTMYPHLGPDATTRDANARTISDWIAQGALKSVVGPASQIAVLSGDRQSAPAGAMLPGPLSVRVSDANGNPVSSVSVTFAVTAGGGALSVTSTMTNGFGVASTRLTLGSAPGTNTVSATSPGLSGSPVSFMATGTAGAATQVVVVSGDNQSATVGSAINPFVVAVKDANGSPVSGFLVTFNVTRGGGTVSSPSVATNASGLASTKLTLGPIAGANIVTASASGLAGSPLTFTAIGTAGPAAQIVSVSGDNQSGPPATALASPFVVRVQDASQNPVAGVTVAFAITAGGGSLSAASAMTDASGQASTLLTLGAQAGANTVVASATGLSGSPLSFTATAMVVVRTLTFSMDVQPILNARCIVCHAPGGVSSFTPLTSYSAVRFGVSHVNGAPLVVAGNPSTSVLVAMTQPTGAMFPNLGPDTATQNANAKIISDWVAQGALNGPLGPATEIDLASGNNQSAATGAQLPNPLVVVVKDANGNPVSGTTVTFAVASGGGTLSAPSAMTDSSGYASTTLRLGPAPGGNSVTASATGLAGTPITFLATGTAGAATQIAIASGSNQSGPVGTALTPFVVSVRDAGGVPVSGFVVSFAVASGGGTLSSPTATTDASGLASTTLTLGSIAGPNTVTANAPGLSGSPITFMATGLAGAATQIALVSGNGQSAQVGAPLSSPLVVKVADANGNPVSGISVRFAVTAGGGSLSVANATTDASGLASSGLTLGPGVGANTVVASAQGLAGSPITFNATGTAGAAARIALVSGADQSAIVGMTLAPFVVSVTDGGGNPVAGFIVTFAVASGGGTLSASSVPTDASGRATASLTLGPTAGTNSVTANASGLAGSPVSFTAIAVPGPAKQIAMISGNNQSATVRTALASSFVVAVKDANGNPVSGVTVTFAVASGGGSLSAVGVPTDASGLASTVLTVGAAPGNNVVTASATGLVGSPVSFMATGTAGAAAQIALVSGGNQSGTVGTALAPFVVSVSDASGAPVSGFLVSFAIASGGGTLSASTVPTDSSGRASTTLTLGTAAGQTTVSANAMGLSGSPVSFQVTGTAGAAARLVLVSGDGQSARVGTALPSPLVVRVQDANSNAVAGATVRFAISAGGGSLSAASATTDGSGLASVTLTLGTALGGNSVAASATGLSGSPITFNATGTAGTPAQVVLVSGNGQSGTVGASINPFVVKVTDSGGTPVSGFVVAFAVTSGGGTLSARSVATDAAGQASSTLTLGPISGTNIVSASAAGLTGSPIAFSATGLAGAAARFALVSGGNQTGPVSRGLASPLVVKVTDAGGNPVLGISVTFAVTAGGGSLSAGSVNTDASGQASTTLTLGPTAGANAVSATATGLSGSPVVFSETGRTLTFTDDVQPILNAHCIVCHAPGGVSSFTPLTSYTAVRFGVSYFNGAPLVVPGNPSSSIIVARTSATGTMYPNLGPDTATRDANAKIISDWVQEGGFNTAVGPAATIALASGNNQNGTISTALPAPFVVMVADVNMNPVSGVSVSFAVASGGGRLSSASVTTNAQGQASTTLTLGPSMGANTVTASANGLMGSPIMFTATAVSAPYSGAPLAGSTNPFDVAGLVALKASNIEPAPLSNDTEFLRRVTADIAGRIPTEAEWLAFSSNTSATKRSTTIDSLLASTDFANHWGLDLMAAWLCVDKSNSDATGTDIANFEAYLIDAANTDKPLSTVASELAQGMGGGGPAFDLLNMKGNRYRAVDRLMETFTGIPSKCSRCHDSKLTGPTDDPKWTLSDNYGLYRFFEVAPDDTYDTAYDPTTNTYISNIPLAFVVDGLATNPTSLPLPTDTLAARRARFAQLLVASNAFQRGMAHRIFGEVMVPLLDPNRILAAPIAGVTVPSVLAASTSVFTSQGTSLKGYLRTLLNSNLYQLTAQSSTTAHDALLARHKLRRGLAEVLEQGVVSATGIADAQGDKDDFLYKFGYAETRATITERSLSLNTIQPLTLMNNPASVTGKVTDPASTVSTLAAQVDGGQTTLVAAITSIFHQTLSRDPTSAELSSFQTEIATAATTQEKLEDVASVLVSSIEFGVRR